MLESEEIPLENFEGIPRKIPIENLEAIPVENLHYELLKLSQQVFLEGSLREIQNFPYWNEMRYDACFSLASQA